MLNYNGTFFAVMGSGLWRGGTGYLLESSECLQILG